MSINAASAASYSSAAQSGENNETARTSLAGTYDTFLKLLTTQLKHQDPLSPMETGEFTSQLVQFASVEQQIQVNDNLKLLLDLQKSSRMATAVGYIDSTVRVAGAQLPLQGGNASFSYELPEASKETIIAISDSAGRIVRQVQADTAEGMYNIVWDGTDTAGNVLPDGAYRFDIIAADRETGKPMADVKSWYTGKVTGVATDENGAVTLSIGDVDVMLDDVREFHSAAN